MPPINFYINKISNRLVYKLELQTSETMKLFGSTKTLIQNTKDGEKVRSLEVFEVAFVKMLLSR